MNVKIFQKIMPNLKITKKSKHSTFEKPKNKKKITYM